MIVAQSLYHANTCDVSPGDVIVFDPGRIYESDRAQAIHRSLLCRPGITYCGVPGEPLPIIRCNHQVNAVVVQGPGVIIEWLEITAAPGVIASGISSNKHAFTLRHSHLHDLRASVSGWTSTRGIKVEKTLIERTQLGVIAYSGNQETEHHDWDILDNHIRDIVDYGKGGDIEAIGGQNINGFRITGNLIEGLGPHSAIIGWQHPDAHEDFNRITSNVIVKPGRYGISIGSAPTIHFRGNMIAGNLITDSVDAPIKLNGAGARDNYCFNNVTPGAHGVKDSSQNGWVLN